MIRYSHENNIDDINNVVPTKIRICHCEQCRYVKNKRKNRKLKKIIKRKLNKKRRTSTDNCVVFYWA